MNPRTRRQRVLSGFYRVFVTKLSWLQAPFEMTKVARIVLIRAAVLSRINLIWQPQHQLREEQEQDETDSGTLQSDCDSVVPVIIYDFF